MVGLAEPGLALGLVVGVPLAVVAAIRATWSP